MPPDGPPRNPSATRPRRESRRRRSPIRPRSHGDRMTDDETAATSGVEALKVASGYLRDPLVAEFAAGGTHISDDGYQILKFHGSYQQDDRDQRNERRKAGEEYAFGFMIRLRLPGGDVHPGLWQGLDDLAAAVRPGHAAAHDPPERPAPLHPQGRRAHASSARSTIAWPRRWGPAATSTATSWPRRCPSRTRATRPFARQRAAHLGAPAAPDARLRGAVARRRGGRSRRPRRRRARSRRSRSTAGPTSRASSRPASRSPATTRSTSSRTTWASPASSRPDALLGWNALRRRRAGPDAPQARDVPAPGGPAGLRGAGRPAPCRRSRRHRPARLRRPDEPPPRSTQVPRSTTAASTGSASEVEAVVGTALGRLRAVAWDRADDRLGWHAQGDGAWFDGLRIENGRVRDDGAVRPPGRAAGARGRARHRLPDHAEPEPLPASTCRRTDAAPSTSSSRDHGVPSGDATPRPAPSRDGLPGPAHLRPGGHRGGARAAGASSTTSRRTSTTSGVGDARADRAHDRLPQRLRPAVRRGDRPRRRRRRPLPGLARRRPRGHPPGDGRRRGRPQGRPAGPAPARAASATATSGRRTRASATS